MHRRTQDRIKQAIRNVLIESMGGDDFRLPPDFIPGQNQQDQPYNPTVPKPEYQGIDDVDPWNRPLRGAPIRYPNSTNPRSPGYPRTPVLMPVGFPIPPLNVPWEEMTQQQRQDYQRFIELLMRYWRQYGGQGPMPSGYWPFQGNNPWMMAGM